MQVISWHRKWEVVFFLPKITRHFILLTDKMKIHRVHNYSYDLRLNESLDSRNAEKMLHNRKKRRETVLWNRQYLWATDNNVSGKSSDTWPLYSKGQHLRYNGENMSLFLFVSAQMNVRKKNCWCHFILLLGGMSKKLCTRLAWISNVHVQNVSGNGKKVRLFVCVFSSR